MADSKLDVASATPLQAVGLPQVGMALTVAALWGFNVPMAKLGVAEFPPLLFTALRFLFAGLLLCFWAWPRSRGQWRTVMIQSVVFGTGHFGLLFVALPHMDSSTATIMVQTGVPLSVLVSWLWLRDNPGGWRLLGLTVACAGIVALAGEPGRSTVFGIALALCASTLWAVSNALVQRLPRVQPFAYVGWVSMIAVPQLVVLSLLFETGQVQAIQTASLDAWLGLAYTVIGASVMAHGLWVFLIARYPLSQIVPLALAAPVVGLYGSVMVFGDVLTARFLLGGALVVLGVAIIQVLAPRLQRRVVRRA